MKKIIYPIAFMTSLYASQDINNISFEGLTQISNEIAIETLNLENNSSYDEKTINEAIKKFYDFKYFDNIWVTHNDKNLTFHFTEKPFIVKIEMRGYKNRDDDLKLLYSQMGIKKGSMFTKKRLEQAKQNLLLALRTEGYIRSVVEVEIETINETSVALKFEVNKGDPIVVTDSLFRGAKSINLDEIRAVIANKKTDCCFTWFYGRTDGEMNFEQLEYDRMRIKDLYLQYGFLDVEVSSAFTKIDFDTNTAYLEYTIEEGEQYKLNNTLIYIDENLSKPEDIYPILRLQKDDVFNIAKLRKDQEYIKTLVANQGYAFAKINYDIIPNKKTHSVDIIYNVLEGEKVYINDVIISGNIRTLDRVIRRNIYLAPKDLFNLTDYKDSINALKRTSYFDNVTIEKRRISSDKVDILVNVTEAATGTLTLGGGYGSYDGWMLNASVSDKNIFGSGLNLGLSLEHSDKRNELDLSLSNPSIRDSIYSGSINLYSKKSLIENSDINSSTGDETTRTVGSSIGIGRGIGRYTRIGSVYAIDNVDVEYQKDKTENSTYRTISMTPYINFNNTDDYYVAREGFMLGTSYQMTGIYGLGGDAKYTISSSYFKYFYSLDKLIEKDWIIRYKTRVKIMSDKGEIPSGQSFYLGGVSSVRGYSSYAFQPDDNETPYKKSWLNTIELSFPLIQSAKMRWALFYDYGTIGEDSFTTIRKSGNGAVISWYSPVGPIQFIFSRAINPQQGDNTSNFEFSLGSRF